VEGKAGKKAHSRTHWEIVWEVVCQGWATLDSNQ
jgi:hypothetical protein